MLLVVEVCIGEGNLNAQWSRHQVCGGNLPRSPFFSVGKAIKRPLLSYTKKDDEEYDEANKTREKNRIELGKWGGMEWNISIWSRRHLNTSCNTSFFQNNSLFNVSAMVLKAAIHLNQIHMENLFIIEKTKKEPSKLKWLSNIYRNQNASKLGEFSIKLKRVFVLVERRDTPPPRICFTVCQPDLCSEYSTHTLVTAPEEDETSVRQLLPIMDRM